MLYTCEFCSTQFEARPQTKRPRACNKESCQKARQRQNEREWHQKNNHIYAHNHKYHQQQRISRYRILSIIIDKLIEAMMAGFTFKGITTNLELFDEIFTNFMHRIGLRQINKLCTFNSTSINQHFGGP